MLRILTHSAVAASAAALFLSMASPPVYAQLACGATIAAGEKVILTADIGPCSSGTDPAIRVIGPATVDMAGHRVLCNMSDRPTGVLVEGKGAKILRGGADGCVSGLDLTGGDGKHKIEDFLATRNAAEGVAINSDKNSLKRVAAVENGDDGFDVDGIGNKIEDAEAVGNGGAGFEVDGEGNKFKRIVAASNAGDGMDIDGNGNQVTDCRLAANDQDGAEINGDGNKMQKCLSTGTAAGSANFAFDVDGANNQLKKNLALANDRGFGLGGQPNVLTQNVALGNTTVDLQDDNAGCGTNTWQKNKFGTSQAAGAPNPGCIQ